MIGGGRGSQIGYIHRAAAARDRLFQLVAGSFDINADRCVDFGKKIGVSADRCYSDYTQMLATEAGRSDGVQVVTIATPNKFHYPMCKAVLEAGMHVICEKPLCFTSGEAEYLKKLAAEQNKIIGVNYSYTGHQMIHQARNMIAQGDIGEIRVINTQFAHGWHSAEVEAEDIGTKWRVTPEMSGPAYVLSDVGTHAYYLAKAMVPGLKIKELMCTRQSFVEARAPLEDNAHVMLHFEGGAVGTIWASCVNAGSMHDQRVRIVGSKASLEWWDEHPNQLSYEIQGKPKQVLDRGHAYLYNDDPAVSCNRIGGGHAVGLFESWANIYHRYALAIDATDRKDATFLADFWYPDVNAGIEGVKLIEKCVESADKGSIWVRY